MFDSSAQQIGLRLMKALSTATDVTYYELLVESEQEAVYASQRHSWSVDSCPVV